MIEAESVADALARMFGNLRRMIVQACLKHWHRHPLELDFDLPLTAVWEALALDQLEDEAIFRAQQQPKE